jgi:Tol biopolymer transport system component
MSPERWKQIELLYHAALEREPGTQQAFLDQACAGDDELLAEVLSLLDHDAKSARFIEESVLRVAARELAGQASSDVQTLPSASLPQIGGYQLLETLGVGGMGEVHLALDIRLGRKVAIKLLPVEFTSNSGRLRRFTQEAHAASSLNHPNIITIHEIGVADSTHYIVTEYIDGETLRQRIKAAPQQRMTLSEAVDVAAQIAAALTAAHEAGITHRDIKPENVMVRRDGIVKVLDFGLAKLTEASPAAQRHSQAPTSGASTEAGVVMGTPRYMSPEQARGERVDASTDIFSLGVMLYEMVTGHAPFAGATTSEVIAAILRDAPPAIAESSPEAPRELQRIVSKALCKDRTQRYSNSTKGTPGGAAGAARELLADLNHLKREMFIAEVDSHDQRAGRLKTEAKYRWVTAGAVAALVVAAVSFGLYRLIGHTRSGEGVREADPKIIPLTSLPGQESEPAFSPDGSRVAFVWRGPKNDNADIYVKQPGAEGLLRLTTNQADDTGPAWAPDGRHLAFLRRSSASGAIYVVPAVGGSERKVAEILTHPGRLGDTSWPLNQDPTWSRDGKSLVIVDKRSREEPFSIFLLNLQTGEKRALSAPPAGFYGDTSPAISPDGKLLAFVRLPNPFAADVYLMPETGGEPRRLTSKNQLIGRVAWTADSKGVVFEMGATLFLASLWRVSSLGGEPQPIGTAGQAASDPAISTEGTRLAWTQSTTDSNIWRLRLSKPNSENPALREFIASTQLEGWPEYSPDGKRILFLSTRSGSYEVWVCGSEGESPLQLTYLNAHTGTPHWSPDGRQIVFDSLQAGNHDIYAIGADGGQPRRLTTDPAEDVAASWSRDGRWIWFSSARSGSSQVWRMPAEGGPAVQFTKHGGFEGFESPDGQFYYYKKGRGIPGIWRIPTTGGEETPVLEEHQAGLERAWKVVNEGIYFATAEKPSHPKIEFFSFATGRITQITSVARAFQKGLSISPDGRWLIFSQIDRTDRDIMLMENFH